MSDFDNFWKACDVKKLTAQVLQRNFCIQPVQRNLHIFSFFQLHIRLFKIVHIFCIFEMAWSRVFANKKSVNFGNTRIINSRICQLNATNAIILQRSKTIFKSCHSTAIFYGTLSVPLYLTAENEKGPYGGIARNFVIFC